MLRHTNQIHTLPNYYVWVDEVEEEKLFAEDVRANPYLTALRKKFRGANFAPYRNGMYVSGGVEISNKYVMWFDGDLITCGVVFTATKYNHSSNTRDDLFGVFSKHIENNKYQHCVGREMAVSVNMDTAVKNATRYIRRVDKANVVASLYRIAARSMQNYVEERDQEVQTCVQAAFNRGPYEGNLLFLSDNPRRTPPYVKELVHLVEAGHEFMDKEFEEKLKAGIAIEKENKMLKQNEGDWYIFYTDKDSAGNIKVVQVKMMVTGEPTSWDRSFDLDTEAYLMDPDEVTEHVQGKVAVLSMVEDSHYVEGVGVRLRENCFYINI